MLNRTSAILLRSAYNAMRSGSRDDLAASRLLCSLLESPYVESRQPQQCPALRSSASQTVNALSMSTGNVTRIHHPATATPQLHNLRDFRAALGRGFPSRGFFSLPGNAGGESGKHYRERRLMGYSPSQMYDVVSAVEHYKEFVPWCERSTVLTRRGEDYMEAELEVGFKVFVERYTSKIHLEKNKLVLTKVADSTLFNALDNRWEFEAGPTPNSCWLTFSIDFSFKSPLYGQLATAFFREVVQRMMGAFESRCKVQYGPSSFASKPVTKPVAA